MSEDLLSVKFAVSGVEHGKRLDVVITDYLKAISQNLEDDETFHVSRSQIASWINDSRVSVDGAAARKAGQRVSRGETVFVSIPRPDGESLEAEPGLPLDVVHEESDFVVINKAPGIAVHPGAGVTRGTVVNALLARYGESILAVGSPKRPGIVHRLDKDTTGLLVVARTRRAYESFVSQFASRAISRRYIALASRVPRSASPISLPIGRDPRDRTRMAVAKTGKAAVTHYLVRESFAAGAVLFDVTLETGRTHQIRVHFHATGAPLIGDQKYPCPEQQVPAALRGAVRAFGRQALHAEKLRFSDPSTGTSREFFVAPPADYCDLIERFRRN